MKVTEKMRAANARNSLLAGQKMTDEQKIERAKNAGKDSGKNMTAAQRSERGRNAIRARYARQNAETPPA